MSSYLGQIGCQGDGGRAGRVHKLSMTQWEAAKFDDACKVPTPCLLLSGYTLFSLDPFMPESLGKLWSGSMILLAISLELKMIIQILEGKFLVNVLIFDKPYRNLFQICFWQ